VSFNHAKMGDTLGAELQCMRGMEAVWEWYTRVDGSTFFKDKLNAVYDNSVQAEDDTELASKASLSDTSPGTGLPGSRGIATQAKSAHDSRISDFSAYFFAYMDKVLNTSADDQGVTGGISYEYDGGLLSNGQVSILKKHGRWAALVAQMSVDSKVLKKNAVSVTSFTGDSGNKGSLAASGMAGKDHTLAGELYMVVTDETVGAVKLSLVLNFSKALPSPRVGGNGNGTERRANADNPITVGQSFEDGETGFSVTLNLDTLSVTGDGGSIFSSVVITNPVDGDSDHGKHFISVKHIAVGGGGTLDNWLVSWYRSNNRDDSLDLVTSIKIKGETGTVAFSMTGSGATITGTFSKANANTALPSLNDADTDIVFDIRSPRLGDVFRAQVSNDEAGNLATKLARRFPVSLPSDTSASSEYADSKAVSVSIT
jgi:hypothetical protein